MTPGGSPRPRSILEAGIGARRGGRFLAVGAAGFRGSFSQEVFGAARESVPATLGMTPEGSRASPPPPDPGISPRRRERVSDVVAARDARPRAGPQHSPKRVRPASWGKHRGVRRAARRLRRTPGTRRGRRSRPGAMFRPLRAATKSASVGPKTRCISRSGTCLRGPPGPQSARLAGGDALVESVFSLRRRPQPIPCRPSDKRLKCNRSGAAARPAKNNREGGLPWQKDA